MREIRMSGLMSVDGNERLPVGLAPRRSSTLPQLADSSTRRNCEDRSGLHNISLLLEGTNKQRQALESEERKWIY